MSSENLQLRKAICEELLGGPLDDEGFGKCPGISMHGGRNAKRDFRVFLTGAPTGSCVHASCAGAIEDFNWRLRSLIGKAEAGGGVPGRTSIAGPVARKPEFAKGPKRPPFDPAKLEEFAARCPQPITEDWLAKRSPIPIPREQGVETALLFLETVFHENERALIFTAEYSQGNYGYHRSSGGPATFRLGDRPGVDAVPSPLPNGGALGVWFLAAPVTGKWSPNLNNRDDNGAPKYGRRHQSCVTSFRYLVLESDVAKPELWLRAVAQLPLPVTALYTSGGKSIHALIRVDASNKGEFDALRDDLLPILTPLGADPAACSAVRLSRLPGCLRHGTREADGAIRRYDAPRLQRLLFLNPAPLAVSLLELR